MSRRHLASACAVAAALALALVPAAAQANSFPLVGWWPMNEGSGQVVHDWSFHGNNGMLGDSPTADDHDPSWVPGVFWGSALHFDGFNDFVTVPASPELQPQNLTVAAWVRSQGGPGGFRYVVSMRGRACDTSAYGLYTPVDGNLAFYVAGSDQVYVSPEASPSIWDGNWHNVAGTFDGSTVRLYVDGQQVGTGTPTPAGTTIDYADLPIDKGMIGAYPGGGCFGTTDSLTFSGDVDGVQIWSRALPVDTIWRTLKALFTSSR